MVDNGDGTFGYTPPAGFTGQDRFFDIICDNDDPPECHGAAVIVDVVDE